MVEQDNRFGRDAVPADLLGDLIAAEQPAVRELIYRGGAVEVLSGDQPGRVSFGDDVGFLDRGGHGPGSIEYFCQLGIGDEPPGAHVGIVRPGRPQVRLGPVEVFGAAFAAAMITFVPAIGPAVSDLAVGQHRAVVQIVDALQDFDQQADRSILRIGDGGVMVADQFDADGHPAQVGPAVPHALAGVIGDPLLVHDAVGASVAGDNIVCMAAVGELAVAKTLAPGNDAQRGVAPELRCVNDDIAGMLAFDFFVSGVEPGSVVDDGALKPVALRI